MPPTTPCEPTTPFCFLARRDHLTHLRPLLIGLIVAGIGVALALIAAAIYIAVIVASVVTLNAL